MTTIVSSLSRSAELCDRLVGGESTLLFAPRFFGKRVLAKHLEHTIAATVPGARCVHLSSSAILPSGELSWDSIVSSMRHQGLEQAGDSESGNAVDVASGIVRNAVEVTPRLFAFVTGGGRGKERAHFELLATLHRLIGQLNGDQQPSLTVLASDDYSLFQHVRASEPQSDLNNYRKIHWPWLRREELDAALAVEPTLGDDEHRRQDWGDRLMRATDGHIGLIDEAMSHARIKKWVVEHDWDALDGPMWSESHILSVVERIVNEDIEGFGRTALLYAGGNATVALDLKTDVLQQLGVLRRVSPGRLELAGGILGKLMTDVHTRSLVKQDTGGMAVGGAGQVILGDDDLVVTHLSDMHVSDRYRFALSWQGGQYLPGEERLQELIVKDIQGQGFNGRVDALVLSGDIVWNGKAEEFTRARSVVTGIVEGLGVGPDRLLLVPGNHDVEWDAPVMADANPATRVSRQNYQNFVELILKREARPVEILAVESKSGSRRLRIVGLDSNHVESRDAAGIGFVDPDRLKEAGELLRADEVSHGAPGKTLHAWFVVHHHVFPATSARLPDAQHGKVSVMANAAQILDQADRSNVELILHGHEHQPSVFAAVRWPTVDGGVCKRVISIGAGSVGVKQEYLGPFARNQYVIIVRRPDAIVMLSRCVGPNGAAFVDHQSLRFTL